MNGNNCRHINNYKCKWIKCSHQKTDTAEWIQKHASYKRVTSDLKTQADKVKRRGILCKWKSKENNTVPDKIDFKTKIVGGKEGHYITIEGSKKI